MAHVEKHSGSIPRNALCRLQNIALRDYQESVTAGQTHRHTDAGQSDLYVSLCFAGDTKSVWMQQHFEQFLKKQRRLEGKYLVISEAEPLIKGLIV